MVKMGFIDYLEVGTSDFATEIEKDHHRSGVSVEPVKYLFDNLPDRPGRVKVNAAVSDRDGDIDVFHIDESYVDHVVKWVRGCGSVEKPHPTAVRYLRKNSIPASAIVSRRVGCRRLSSIVSGLGVSGIYFLKVDAEGHDGVILKDFLIDPSTPRPHVIKFEINELSDRPLVGEVLDITQSMGYNPPEYDRPGTNVTTRLNLDNLKNKGDALGYIIPGYYIPGYPRGYKPNNKPHGNSFEEARHFCLREGCNGVTYEGGSWEVRSGSRIIPFYERMVHSWLFK